MLVRLNGDKNHLIDEILNEMAIKYSNEYSRDLKSYFMEKRVLLKKGVITAFGYVDGNKIAGYLEYEIVSHYKASFTMLYAIYGLKRNKILCQLLNESTQLLREEKITEFVCNIPPISSIPLTRVLNKVGFNRYKRLEMELVLDKLSLNNFEEITTEGFCLSKADELTKLMLRSFAGSIDSIIYSEFFTPKGQRKVLNQIVEGNYGEFLAQESLFLMKNNEIIGYGLVTAKNRETCFLMDFAIAPHEQGKGLSKKLLNKMFQLLIQKGYTKMSLAVTMDNKKALNLYKQIGFKKINSFNIYLKN
ncbi:GNAT family N-acetyltransferase [Alkalicella caledoniensis]|uniref:GNAT family N-acetyltransferase n=1 Tax=Alkalicella caledoniensis TaxID=2731377 RepID=A0A7G9W528_ALKCA|nr:GNAT family N-acetyltransferase [Alkalicella caledoniensis]QNO13790.1 GNAT family N-acetyltransferase [Alkalicella caledoniensis]